MMKGRQEADVVKYERSQNAMIYKGRLIEININLKTDIVQQKSHD